MRLEDIDFVIAGAAKSATTWLQKQLQSDPAIYMPDPELHFFSREDHRGIAWYLDQFEPGPGVTVIGEKSNSYLDTPGAAERLHHALPHAKLVLVLRDPVQRAYSDYCMLYRRGEVSGRIEEHLDPRHAAEGRFLGGSRYDLHLRRLLEHYPASALHVTQFEKVATDPQGVLDGVRAHIGCPPRPLGQAAGQRSKDRETALLPLGLRRLLKPLKPAVAPLRGTRGFEAARGLFAARPEYPPLPKDLANRLEDHFDPIRAAVRHMGYPLAGGDT